MKMRKRLAAAIASLVLSVSVAHATEPPSQVEELDTVLVTGEQQGPGLWKITKGDHVMWVLASFGPLPKGMTWRSRQVEALVAESQEVLYPGYLNVSAGIGILRGITLIPAALKAGKIPDGKTLKDVVPADTYSKWLALRERYIGKDDDVEKWRPSIALGQLRDAAAKKSDLQGGPRVREVVTNAAKKNKVRIQQLPAIKREVKVENPRGMLKTARTLALPDLDCFTRGLDLVEPEIERVRTMGNAWARGDIAKLRSLNRVRTIREDCTYALMAAFNEGQSADAARAKKIFADIEWHVQQGAVQVQRDWVAAAMAALDQNRLTFAVLGVDDAFRADGPIENMRTLGYTVEEPR
ncbi:MAG: TraB/GumN family protein [Steroidobacteraceae bacterium]